MSEHDEGAAQAVPTPNGSATVSFVDGKIRYWADARLSDEAYKEIRDKGFSWHRGERCFIAKYSPWREDYLTNTYGVELEPEDNEEREAFNAERAEARAERFGTYATNAGKRSQAHFARSHQMAEVIPFGQPILVGHHSERTDRNYRAKIWRQMDKSVEEGKKAQYWQHRAEAVVRHLKQKENPGVIFRRIQELEADLRRVERELQHRPGDRHDPAGDTYWQRFKVFYEHRLDYERALYAASGGIPAEANDLISKLEVGGMVEGRWGKKPIVRINKGQDGKVKSVSVPSGYSWTDKVTVDRITKVWTKAEVEAAAGTTPKAPTTTYVYEVGGAVESPYSPPGSGVWLEIRKVNRVTVFIGPREVPFRKAALAVYGKPMSKAEWEAHQREQRGE